jgi:hypothetical protein
MSGVFLSYSRADHAIGEQVIAGLRALGVDCWWDEDMPGVPWQEELERQINQLGALVVIWTQASKNSRFVRAEATLALGADKLVNVLYGVDQPPFPFNGLNGLPLDGWTGREPHSGWTRLVKTIEDQLIAAGAVEAGAVTGALAAWEQAVSEKHQALAAAEQAYAEAKAAEDEAASAADAARSALNAAKDQLRRVGDVQPGPAVLRAAQAEFEQADKAAAAAAQRHREAGASLPAAARQLSQARDALDRMFAAPTPSASRPAAGGDEHRPGPRWSAARSAMIAGAALVALLAVGAFVLLAHRPPAPPGGGQAGGGQPGNPFDDAVAALRADWSGPGASCPAGSNPGTPLNIAVDRDAAGKPEVTVAQEGAPPGQGSIVGHAKVGEFKLNFGGAVWTYTVLGKTLTITSPDGAHEDTYTKCDEPQG